MSEPIAALRDATFDGLARIEGCPPQGMITLRGDLSARAVTRAIAAAAGVGLPGRGRIRRAGTSALCWMSPDELLLLCPHEAAPAMTENLTEALSGLHALAVDVSDARAMFRLSGPAARDVLAKLCPVDLSPAAFRPGTFRRTRLAQVPAALWMEDGEEFRILCFRSVAQYAFDLLKTAADPAAAVGFHTPPDRA